MKGYIADNGAKTPKNDKEMTMTNDNSPFEFLKKQSLVNICLNKLGYTPVPGKDTRNGWRALQHENGQKIIAIDRPNGQTGEYLYFPAGGTEGGNILKLLKQVHGYTDSAIYSAFCNGEGWQPAPFKPAAPPPPPPKRLSPAEVKDAYYKYLAACVPSHQAFYLKSRGISPEIIDLFRRPAQKQAFMLPLYAIEGEEGQEQLVAKTAITYTPKKPPFGKGQRYLAGAVKEGAFVTLPPFRKPLRSFSVLRIFESPIDAMSYTQLFPDKQDALFIAYCGGYGAAQERQIGKLVAFCDIKKVVVCLDNDVAGKKAAASLQGFLQKHPTWAGEVELHFPLLNDWNDELLQKHTKIEQNALVN